MLCGPEAKEPSFLNYDSITGTVVWETPAACVKESPDDPPEANPDEPSAPSGSGLGWFFFLSDGFFESLGVFTDLTSQILPGFGSLLYHWCISQLHQLWSIWMGSRAVCFLKFPLCRVLMFFSRHRDFWRDVPFLLRDLAQHLINAVRGGPSRGGYHAV